MMRNGKKELGGYFPSIYKICHHLFLADITWLDRFRHLRSYQSIKGEVFNTKITWENVYFDPIKEYLEHRIIIDNVFENYSREIKEEELRESLEYTNMKGEYQKRNFGGLLIHVFNYQIHHRGMLSVYLEQLGRNNDFSNLLVLV